MQQANSHAFGFQQVANFRPNGSLSIAPLDPGSFGNLQSGGNFEPGNAAASTMSAFAGATGQPHFGSRFPPGPLALGAQGGALGRGWASSGGECEHGFTKRSVYHQQLQQSAVHTEGVSGSRLSLCVGCPGPHTAYMYGQWDAQQTRHIEDSLSYTSDLRNNLHRLWDAPLPTPLPVDAAFTQVWTKSTLQESTTQGT